MKSALVVLLSTVILFGCQKQVVADVDQQDPEPAVTDITGKTWLWQASYLATGEEVTPDHPEKFTISLKPDGEFAIKADCNVGGGPVTIEEKKFVIGMYRLSRAYCGEQSLDSSFREHLGNVDRWSMMNGDLMLQLSNQSGFMLFSEEGN